MEGMAMGWDGSRGVVAMGHDFVCVSLVGAAYREAQPVYAKLAKGRKSKGELHGDALEAVMEATGGRGWTAEDRGMDSAEHIRDMKVKMRKGVVRVNDMKRDVFGDGRSIDKSLASVPFRKAHLHAHRGDRRVEIRWKRGTVQYCENPKRKDAPVEDVGVLVVESRFDGKSTWLYAVCPDEMYETEEGAPRGHTGPGERTEDKVHHGKAEEGATGKSAADAAEAVRACELRDSPGTGARKRRGGRARASPLSGDAFGSACRARSAEGNG